MSADLGQARGPMQSIALTNRRLFRWMRGSSPRMTIEDNDGWYNSRVSLFLSDEFHHRQPFFVRYLVEALLPFPGLLPHIDVAEFFTERFRDQGIDAKSVKRLDQGSRQPLGQRLRCVRPSFRQLVEILVPRRAGIEGAADPFHARGEGEGCRQIEIRAD